MWGGPRLGLCDWKQERLFVRQSGEESLGAAHSRAELCWRRVRGYPRRGGGTKCADALGSTPRRLQQPLPSEEKEREKIRLRQDVAWIEVTRPRVVELLCLREVRQEEGGGLCDTGNCLPPPSQLGFQIQHLGQPQSSLPASSPAVPFSYFGTERSPLAPLGTPWLGWGERYLRAPDTGDGPEGRLQGQLRSPGRRLKVAG